MTTIDSLDRWRNSGAITAEQHTELSAVVRRDRFSVFLELNALLYFGVLAFVAGLGWTIYEHFSQLGDVAVIVPLVAIFVASLYYCSSRAQPFTSEQVESPTFAFDYVLYLACLVFAVGLGYVEFRFQLLKAAWDYYLLASAVLYFLLAYRFDNRFVLSLAISTLGGWFGVRLFALGLHVGGSVRGDALAYAALLIVVGSATHRLRLKPHFLETYLHVAANAALAALASLAWDGEPHWFWILALAAASGVTIERAIHFRRFAFVVYGILYGYWGLSAQFLRTVHDAFAVYWYFIISGIAVVGLLVVMSRRVGREE